MERFWICLYLEAEMDMSDNIFVVGKLDTAKMYGQSHKVDRIIIKIKVLGKEE